MAKVTGIGGVFFKSRSDATVLSDWYRKHLGVEFAAWGGAILKWTDDAVVDGGITVLSIAKPETTWFAPSESSFMINYRVDDLDGMLAQLTADGVPILKGPDSEDNGKFAWLLDPDGNKIELWEPKAYAPSATE